MQWRTLLHCARPLLMHFASDTQQTPNPIAIIRLSWPECSSLNHQRVIWRPFIIISGQQSITIGILPLLLLQFDCLKSRIFKNLQESHKISTFSLENYKNPLKIPKISVKIVKNPSKSSENPKESLRISKNLTKSELFHLKIVKIPPKIPKNHKESLRT